ncbi:protein-tyrosine phosphatase family protein [Shimia aestuarii]|nr:protein-tyrosine phosphatase family protein [Shimia aestuarii]
MAFMIAEVTAANGVLGICPLPGVDGDYERDFRMIEGWAPDFVISMTEPDEMRAVGAEALGSDLGALGITFHSLPICDFGAPGPDVQAAWPDVSKEARAILSGGGRVLVHCRGGCGRSGMILLRLMVEMDEVPEAALVRLRAQRPCAVETKAQMAWAFAGKG